MIADGEERLLMAPLPTALFPIAHATNPTPRRRPRAQAQYRGNCGRAIAERKGALRQMEFEGGGLCASLPPSPEIGAGARRRAGRPATVSAPRHAIGLRKK